MNIFPSLKRWLPDFAALRRLLLNPGVQDEEFAASLEAARQRQPVPVIWLLGKTQAGKTSIIQALTGSPWADKLVDVRVDDSPQPLIELRRLLNIQPGQKLRARIQGDHIELIPEQPISAARGFLRGIDTHIEREDDRV